MRLTQRKIKSFQHLIWDYYEKNRRILPWREDTSPYSIVISEIMLQQTQVSRILTKYPPFIASFPDFKALATASLQDVLKLWQGIGYSRRAMYLQKIAQKVISDYNGTLPDNPVILESFPGIGPATAASITVYAFNKPVPFIETNVRRIYIHHFFRDKEGIDDKEIMPLVEDTLDVDNPREWYWALMDYGVELMKLRENPNKRSKHYVVQSKFEGSKRQIRGLLLKTLVNSGKNKEELYTVLAKDKERVDTVLKELVKEGFVKERDGKYVIK